MTRTRSLPSRERGLKFFSYKFNEFHDNVAPFAGAWIEMAIVLSESLKRKTSLPSRERGLKFHASSYIQFCHRRSLRGSVD